MPLYVSAKADFKNCPEGVFSAVCIDVVDLGIVATNFGNQQMIRIVLQVDERDPDIGNKRFMVSKRYNRTLSERANLRNDLEAWRGRKFTREELEQFDLERLIGVPAMINVIHRESAKGGLFANIAAITPLPKGMQRITVEDYVRVSDRPTTGQQQQPQQPAPRQAAAVTSMPGRREPESEPIYEEDVPPPTDDDDIPF